MKKFYIFALVATMFAACTTDETQDLQPVDAPETLTVGFEENTRIQLNEAQKTVWTKDDLVSVFYRSDANQKWQFQGETGERVGNLKRVSAGSATETMKRVVVVYPYNENYYINTETYNVEATLPATQTYLKDSYGLDGNLMVSSDEFNQISLKSVYGWLKLQLTGEGEKVTSITLHGNNNEQVAGLVYINSSNAAMTLAAEMGSADDPEVGGAGGNLVFDDTIQTEVTLNCGNGVELGAEATAFYIALPPQTFEKGLAVEIATTEGKIMGQYTDKEIVIERNTIQPMASVAYNGIFKPANNEIYYTNGSTTKATAPNNTDVFGANIVSNLYNAEKECWIITFDGDVTKIGTEAFWNCTSLTSVTIPDSVTEIGGEAFLGCDSLTSVNIPDGVTSIGIGAFKYCTSLTSVTIPDSVTSIGERAFYHCTSLTSVNIPSSVTWIGNSAFENCSSLATITIPDNVTVIGPAAFYDCSSLITIAIPNSVISIGDTAFCNCTSLKAFYGKFASKDNRCLIINGTLNSFAIGCGETSYTIPDSVISIGQQAFRYCTSLTSVTIGNSVTSIGNYAFRNCTSLTSVTIPDSVTKIGNSAFADCTLLTSINIGNSVTKIENFTFSDCTLLTSVNIGNSVALIGEGAFRRCTSLTSITIPDSVTKIGNSAFRFCESLKEVYCKPTTPPTGGDYMFSYTSNGSYLPIGCKIYVPASDDDSIIKAYKAELYWSDYASYIEEYDFSAGQ